MHLSCGSAGSDVASQQVELDLYFELTNSRIICQFVLQILKTYYQKQSNRHCRCRMTYLVLVLVRCMSVTCFIIHIITFHLPE